MTKPTFITLDEAQSAVLTAAGPQSFAIVARGSYPHATGRWVIHLAPLEWPTAVAASNVLLGSHRAAKVKATPPKPKDP